jgi:23S rRNA (uracil1939-C5)-methyltransferase
MLARARRSEAAAPCPHFPRCAGCPWVSVPYPEQLARKAERVREAVAAYPALAGAALLPVRPAPRVFGYRSLVKLVARRVRGDLRLGVYRRGTHQVVDARQCAAHDALANAVLAKLAAAILRLGVPTWDEGTREGWLRYVLVRVGARRRAQVVLVVRDRSFPRERELLAALRGVRGVAGVVLNLNADPGNVILGKQFAAASGARTLAERMLGVEVESRAGSFQQANPRAARAAYARVVELADVSPRARVLDLFCGVGVVTIALARAGALAHGVDASELAIADARANAAKLGVRGARFSAGDAGAALREMVAAGGRVDLVTLNPPRRGAGPGVCEAIAALAPRRIVYMSCDPDTLARDLADLAARGYATRSIEPYDFLPHTEHVEAVALAEARQPAGG